MEKWLDIKDYEGYYQISSLGRVKSLKRIDRINRSIDEKIRKTKLNNRGYEQVSLYKNGKSKYFLVHRLVAEAFIKNGNNFPQVNHIDENNQNNIVENLEWCTNKYNANFGSRIERAGINHRKSVKAFKNGEVFYFDGITIAEKKLGMASNSIKAAIKRNGTAKGYKFEFVN